MSDEQIADYVAGPDGRLGRLKEGGHADDQNGVCVFCNLCIDPHCCGRLIRCPAQNELPPEVIR